eukprot:scaffold187023_cov31-Tisochrysis_lutea.AAC.9
MCLATSPADGAHLGSAGRPAACKCKTSSDVGMRGGARSPCDTGWITADSCDSIFDSGVGMAGSAPCDPSTQRARLVRTSARSIAEAASAQALACVQKSSTPFDRGALKACDGNVTKRWHES